VLTPVASPKALQTPDRALSTADCVAGTFRFDPVSGKLHWSEEIYLIHGYCRGEIVPTIELVLSHKHPDDRKRSREIFARVRNHGGCFYSYDRLIDAHLREHRILTAGEGLLDDTGRLSSIDGFVIDLTRTMKMETEQVARAAVAAASATRSTIEQAKGILMGALHIGSDAAFNLLVRYSQHTNIKLARTAADLVYLANKAQEPALLDSFITELHHGAAAHRSRPIGVHRHPGRRSQRSL
jgi:hypothetical protein